MCVICNLISEAKAGNPNSMLELLNKFKPLIGKYSYKMNYEDAENDLILSVIQLINDMPYLNNDGQAVNYINQSIYNAYIKYIKLQIKKRENEYLYDTEEIKNISMLYDGFSETDVDLQCAMEQLSKNQRNVIILKFMYMMPDKEIMEKLKLSRQSVYKNKIKGLEKLKEILKEL